MGKVSQKYPISLPFSSIFLHFPFILEHFPSFSNMHLCYFPIPPNFSPFLHFLPFFRKSCCGKKLENKQSGGLGCIELRPGCSIAAMPKTVSICNAPLSGAGMATFFAVWVRTGVHSNQQRRHRPATHVHACIPAAPGGRAAPHEAHA